MDKRQFLSPLLKYACSILLILTLSRLGLALWQSTRLIGSDDWYRLFLGGLRIDLSSIAYLLILPILLHCFLAGDHLIGRLWAILLRIWLTLGFWLVVFMEVSTIPYILEYDLRPNRLFIEYLVYPKEVFGMLWTGYKLELFVGLVATVASLMAGWKLTKRWQKDLEYPKWYWRPVFALLLLTIAFIGARGTFGHRPLNPSLVAFSSDPLINDLTLNSAYSLLFHAKQMQAETNAIGLYPDMDEAKVIRLVQANMNISSAFPDPKRPTYAYHPASYQGSPKNIVIILLESHGAQFVSRLGGINASPNIDKAIDEGWAFTQAYATGTRSVRGIEAVVSGFPPTPARATVKLGKTQTHFFTIADVLAKRGYHTQFIYGGESHFDNMKRFFLGNGFQDIQDLPTFKTKTFVGSWGACDEDLFTKADQTLSALAENQTPFFSLIFTLSNHTPFEYPDGKFTPYNSPTNTLENAVKYADYALGKFIRKAKRSNYWKNTIFLIAADHDTRAHGTEPVPIKSFHIPAVIIGDGIAHRIDNRLVSQLDLPPTLLSLAGISAETPMIGYDLTKEVSIEKQRALMQRDTNFAWLNGNNELAIFQPKKPIETYLYNRKKNEMTKNTIREHTKQTANAFALWGSIAYQNDYYRQRNQY